MDKEKEVEELTAKIIEQHCYHHGCDDCEWKHSRGGCEEEAIYRDLARYLIEEEDYRPADEVRKEKAKEILSGLVHWLKGAIRDSYDHAVKEQFGIYGGKNNAFHEVLDLVNKVAENDGIEVDG